MTSHPKPTYKAQRRIQNGRLAYYMRVADADFWDTHWQPNLTKKVYQRAEAGYTGMPKLNSVYAKYLPKKGRVLEAGCGIGNVVLALRSLGYDAEGVEWGEKTVAKVKEILPDLPIRTGDVTNLDVPDGHYQAYISIGVIEHRQQGPEPFLVEAYRILAPGGMAFISVPYLHPLRKLKGTLGLYRGKMESIDFYQYAYSREELDQYMRQAGFEPIAYEAYDGFKGIKDELSFVQFLAKRRYLGWGLRHLFRKVSFIENTFGHMMMVICRKPLG